MPLKLNKQKYSSKYQIVSEKIKIFENDYFFFTALLNEPTLKAYKYSIKKY